MTQARRRRRAVIAFAVVCAVVAGILLLPAVLWLGNFLRCGHRPIETSDFAASNSYTVPGDGTYTYYPVFTGYACDLSEVRGRQHSTL